MTFSALAALTSVHTSQIFIWFIQNLHFFISAPQISGESAIFSPTNLEALATVEKVEDLSKQTTAIAEQAVHWLTRSTAAEKQALTFQSEADRFLKETQSTLDVVTNFDVKVAGMEGYEQDRMFLLTRINEI